MKSIVIAAGVAWLGAAAAAAQDVGAPPSPAPAVKPAREAKSGLRTWFEHLKQGLRESSLRRHYQRRGRVTAVAAVRGAAQDASDPDKPHWKGARKSRESSARRRERAELSQAVDLILKGDVQAGQEKLAAFEASHPDSPYLADAREARAKAQELGLSAPEPEKASP